MSKIGDALGDWTVLAVFILVLFACAYFGVINILSKIDKITEVGVDFYNVPICSVDIPKPVGACEDIFVKDNEGGFLLDGRNCSFELSGNVSIVCEGEMERDARLRVERMFEEVPFEIGGE